jgi:hypothetical protein
MLGRQACRAFDEVVIDFDPAVGEEKFKLRPLAQGIVDGFAKFAFGQDTALGQQGDGFVKALVDDEVIG